MDHLYHSDPKHYNGAENFLPCSDAVAFSTSQSNALFMCVWWRWCEQTYCSASTYNKVECMTINDNKRLCLLVFLYYTLYCYFSVYSFYLWKRKLDCKAVVHVTLAAATYTLCAASSNCIILSRAWPISCPLVHQGPSSGIRYGNEDSSEMIILTLCAPGLTCALCALCLSLTKSFKRKNKGRKF